MNSILKLFFISILFNSILFAQDNFYNIYLELGDNSQGLKIKKLEDDSFILLGFVDDILTEISLNNNGDITNTKSLSYLSRNLVSIDFTSGNGYAILTKKENSTKIEYFLTILNSNKDVLLEKLVFTQLGNYFNASIMSSRENNMLISYFDSESPTLNLIYLNATGKILWQNSFNSAFSVIAKYPLLELKDGTFLAATRNRVINLNQNGDSLWSYDTEGLIYDFDQFKLNDDLIIGTSNSIQKVNNDGVLLDLFESNKFRELSSISTFDDNSVVVFNLNSYFLFSPTFELVDEDITKINTFHSYTDGEIFYSLGSLVFKKFYYPGFYYLGLYTQRSENISLLRWNKNQLPIKNIVLFSPNGGESYPQENFSSQNKFHTHWYSLGVKSVKIDFSTDGGSQWQVLATIDSTQFEEPIFFEIPYINSDECLVRISDADDPSIFDISTNYFSIRAYRYHDYIAGNECFMWIGNNGMSAHNPITDDCGFFWPGGENATIPSIFTDGILWGGIHKGMIKVNGSTWRDGLKPGAILPDGTAGDPTKSEYSIFKLKKDWQSLPPGIEKDRMEYTYNNWPGELGAPFEDVNNDGIFTNGVDVPKILGEETLFYVANDLDSTQTAFTYGSPPIGLEFQQTLFAYNTPELKDAVFKKVRLINKSDSILDSMYVGYWSDPDLGYAGDDFVGCDTALNMMYTYNGDNDDEDYYGTAPPALGYIQLQGPIVKSVNKESKDNYLGISAHMFFGGGAGSIFENPELGTYKGSIEFYNNMKGLLWNGDPVIDPNTIDTTAFVLSGDPVTGIGWYEGEGWPRGPNPDDRTQLMSSGPFTMAPGDTQEVVYAIFMARGSSNIQSVAELKKTARALHEFWSNYIPVSVNRNNNTVPTTFSLSQNYPNPFNPSTTIKYSIPQNTVILSKAKNLQDFSSQSPQVNGAPQNDNVNVELIVYDILGRKVKTLVNQKQKPGNYEVEFNASKLASGMYFYRLNVNNNVAIRKMMLLK